MSLGTTSDGIYAAPSLGPNRGHIFAFAASQISLANPLLTVASSALTDYQGTICSAQLASVILAAPNSYSGGTIVKGTAYANATGALGTGDVMIEAGGMLIANAPDAMDPSAQLTISGSLTANSSLSARAINVFGTLAGNGVLTAKQGIYIGSKYVGCISPGDNEAADVGTLRLETPYPIVFLGILAIDAFGASSDELVVSGELILPPIITSFDSGTLLQLCAFDLEPGRSYTLVEADSIVGQFSRVIGLPDSYMLDYSQPGRIMPTPAPEPGTWGLLAGGTAVMMGRRRRRA